MALVAGGRETSYRVEALASRLAHLLVIDTLFTSLLLASPGRARAGQERAADVLAGGPRPAGGLGRPAYHPRRARR